MFLIRPFLWIFFIGVSLLLSCHLVKKNRYHDIHGIKEFKDRNSSDEEYLLKTSEAISVISKKIPPLSEARAEEELLSAVSLGSYLPDVSPMTEENFYFSETIKPLQYPVNFANPVTSPGAEKFHEYMETLPPLDSEKKVRVILVIADALRRDFITPTQSPRITEFLGEAIGYPNSYGGSTDTAGSLFSLFFGLPAYYQIPFERLGITGGSYYLQVLKKHGYRINVFGGREGDGYRCLTKKVPSGMQSTWWPAYEVIFGINSHLINRCQEGDQIGTPSIGENEGYDDRRIILQALTDILSLKNSKNGQFFLIHLKNINNFYKFATDLKEVYKPTFMYGSQTPPLTKEGLMKNINAYANAVLSLDHDFGILIEELKKEGLFDESMIIFTANHGERLLGKKRFGHGGLPDYEVTNTPLIVKYPKEAGHSFESHYQPVSLYDIFPTILEVMGKEIKDHPRSFGKSLRLVDPNRYAVVVSPNGHSDSVDMALINSRYKAHITLNDGENILIPMVLK